MPMKTSALGVQAIAQREGRILHAYRDTRNILTIGVGHTSAAGPPGVAAGMVITSAECDDILSRDLAKFEDAVNAALKKAITENRLSQNAFDACVSLAFNIGGPGFTGSSVARDINDDEMQTAADAFLMWDHPPELRGRREGERAQFLRPDSGAAADASVSPQCAARFDWLGSDETERGRRESATGRRRRLGARDFRCDQDLSNKSWPRRRRHCGAADIGRARLNKV